MNAHDPFEQRLRRQPLRPVPSAWRAQILAAATADWRPGLVRELTWAGTLKLRLRELLWPCPQAWAGLAAVWVVVLFLNLSARQGGGEAVAQRPPPTREVQMVLQQQERLMAELLGTAEREPAEPQRRALPGPRSERRRELIVA